MSTANERLALERSASKWQLRAELLDEADRTSLIPRPKSTKRCAVRS